MFVFVCGFATVLLFFLFLLSFVFISGQNFSTNSKDKTVTTRAVELNIRTMIAFCY